MSLPPVIEGDGGQSGDGVNTDRAAAGHKPAPSAKPDAAFLFDPVKDRYGKRLALVLGNEAGVCPFYERQCVFCDIGAGEGRAVFTPAVNRGRLEFFRRHYGEVLPQVAHLVLYNSGSVLNERELSRETLGQVLDFAAELPRCSVVSLDSREAFIKKDVLEFIRAHLREDQLPRVILGLETQSDEIRIGVLHKRMSRKGIEQAFGAVGSFGGRVGMDINILFQPPEVTGEAALVEGVETARYSLDLSARHGVPVDFNVHPYYPSHKALRTHPDHPRATQEDSVELLRRIHTLLNARGSDSAVFLGWQDEEHDQEQAVRRAELDRWQRLFAEYNRTQRITVFAAAGEATRETRRRSPR